MLVPPTATRRTPPSTNQKPELPSLSDIALITPADNYAWRFPGTGSIVQTAGWELTDHLSKLRIAGEDSLPKMRNIATPGQDGSPLETSSNTSLDSSPSDQNLALPTHSRGSSTDVSNGRALPGSIDQNWPHGDQPTFPSLSTRDQQDFQVDYSAPQRQFPGNAFNQPRMNNAPANAPFRQPQVTRAFNQQLQNVVPNPANFTYPMPTLASGATQQLYDMIMPQDPAITRVQGQPFRPTHQHSASDPASLREAAALQQLLTNNLAQFPAGLYPPTALGGPTLSMFANQFYPPESYAPSELAAAQLMARQLQSQYTGSFANTPANNSGMTSPASTVAQNPAPNGNGPSANNRKLGLYKTELCRSWEEKGSCRYANKCQFAHGEEELRKVPRHPKYKTEICRTFWVSGSCPYGKRCCFIHTEVPAGGQGEGTPPPSEPARRDRSSSTNSDPNDTSGSSLLARISAKRNQDANSTGSVNSTPPPPASSGRPQISLRVDTSVLDPLASKQNKSAYPTLANGMLIQANVPAPIMTHGPVTAGPDFGRHASARLDIVGQRKSRPSMDGAVSGMEPVTQSPHNDSPPLGTPRTSSRASGHTRSGSAGNWNMSGRSNLRDYRTAGPDGKPSAPWLTDISSGSSRLQEQTWG